MEEGSRIRTEMQKLLEKKRSQLEKGTDPLFCSPFVGKNKVQKLLQLAQSLLETLNDQARQFIGLVQASLCGKTRLLKELSLKQPLLLLSFKSSNKAYHVSLLQALSKDQLPVGSFDEREKLNRRIILRVAYEWWRSNTRRLF